MISEEVTSDDAVTPLPSEDPPAQANIPKARAARIRSAVILFMVQTSGIRIEAVLYICRKLSSEKSGAGLAAELLKERDEKFVPRVCQFAPGARVHQVAELKKFFFEMAG